MSMVTHSCPLTGGSGNLHEMQGGTPERTFEIGSHSEAQSGLELTMQDGLASNNLRVCFSQVLGL